MQPQPADPRLGVWNMNTEKSQYGVRPKPKSSTVTWASQGGGMYGYTADGIGPDGQPTHVTFSARFDGQDYKVAGSPILDAVSVKRIDARHIEATGKKNGQVVLTTKNAISEDGKTETTVWSGMDEKGQPQGWTTVLEKQ